MFNLFSWASPSDAFRTLFFIPYKDINGNIHPLLGVGWTLNIEMYFYAIFSFALFLGKSLAPIFSSVVIVAVWSIGKHAGAAGSDWLRLYSNDYTLYFAGGIAVYYLWTGLNKITATRTHRRYILGAIATISASTYIFSNLFYFQTAASSPLALAAGPSLLVLAALLAHTIGHQIKNGFILLLGAASYSLYLEHTIALEMLRTLTNKPGSILNFSSTVPGIAIAAAACVTVAIAIHLKVEMPSLAWLKRKLKYKLNPA
jgi:exopolysaccharide production protein ExoZ